MRHSSFAGISVVLIGFMLLITACKKEPEAPQTKRVEDVAKPLTGVYQISSWTLNEGSCKEEGKDQLPSEDAKFFVAYLAEGFGGDKFLMVTSCTNMEECKKEAKSPTGGRFMNTFSGTSGENLTGISQMTGFQKDKICNKGSISELLFQKDGDGIKMETRTTIVPDYPFDEKEYCSTKKVKELAKGIDCNEYTVIRGKKIADL
jgi:hypothetical protein